MMKIVKRFRNEEKGATAIEYGLLAALIGVAIIAGASALGTGVSDNFGAVAEELCTAQGGAWDAANSTCG